jgi:predicted permease
MLTFDRGFDPSNLLKMETALPESRYQTADQIRDFFSKVLTGLTNTPGVQAASASAGMGDRPVRIEGRPEPSSNEPPVAVYAVTPEYVAAMRMHVRKGRPIASSDGPDSRGVIVISESLVRRYWPDSSPLGQRVRLGKEPQWLSIVGVVGDTADWFSGQPEPRAYVAFAQWPQLNAEFFLRTQGDPLLLARDARRQVYQADPLQPVFRLDSMDHMVAVETSGLRSSAASMTTYAAIALLLAITGIYSLTSYLAAQRTSEMGLRMALGADRRDILLLSIVQSGRLAALGLTIGLAAAFALAQLMSSVLFGVVALDWKTFAEVTALLAGCVLVAMWVPAYRASRIDPVIALRHE